MNDPDPAVWFRDLAKVTADEIEGLRAETGELRAWLAARETENNSLRGEVENERLKEQNYLTVLNANQIEMNRLRAENEQTREINQLRVQATDKLRADNARLRALLQKTLDEGWVDYGTELSNEIGAELGGKP